MSEELNPAPKLGIQIERPFAEVLGSRYYLIVLCSLILIGVTAWLLVSEWFELPLPEILKLLSHS